MKFSYNWLKDFVDIDIKAEALAEKLTMAGHEIGAVESRDGDFILEAEITSNRADCFCMTGIAREVAAVTGRKFKAGADLFLTLPGAKKSKSAFSVVVDNNEDCPLYTATLIRGVKVGPSPEWLRRRLENIGCRSVNNVVDITNYALFEWGAPLHAFDLDKLNGPAVRVRRAEPGESLLTLDGKKQTLGQEILVIADSSAAIAAAGIMGGADTEVSGQTVNLLLEAAVFDPVLIRRARQAMCVQTEASYRFERGVDFERVAASAERAVKLIVSLCGGSAEEFISRGIKKPVRKNIVFSLPAAEAALNVKLSLRTVHDILSGLGFSVKRVSADKLSVEVPLYRRDVSQQADLVEEVARIYGYEKIPSAQPSVKPALGGKTDWERIFEIKNFLAGQGFCEAVTYSLVENKPSGLPIPEPGEALQIMNPLSKEQEVLRTSVLPGLLRCLAYNLNQKQEEVRLFEIADIYFKPAQGEPCEERMLSFAVCGTRRYFNGELFAQETIGALHIKGALEALFEICGVADYKIVQLAVGAAADIYIGKEKVGDLLWLDKRQAAAFEIKNRTVALAQIRMAEVLRAHKEQKRKFRRLPAYPAIYRDISVVLKENVLFQDVLAVVRQEGGDLLKEISLTDLYKGEQIPCGFKGITVSCLYRCQERTLTEEEVSPLHDKISKALSEKLGASLR